MKILYTPNLIAPALTDDQRSRILAEAGSGARFVDAKDVDSQRKEIADTDMIFGRVPNEVFEFAVGNDAVTANNWGYRLEPSPGPDGDGTLVTEYFRLEPNLPMRIYWLLLGPLRGRTNEKGMRTTLERMKAVVEGG